MPRQKQSAPSRRAADRDPDRDGLEDRPSLTLFDDDEDYDSAEDLDYQPSSSPTAKSFATKTRRSSKKSPTNEEICDDFLKTLIAGAKYHVAVNVIPPTTEHCDGPSTSSSSKRGWAQEWRESIGLLDFKVAENSSKALPGREAFLNGMNGMFWIYVSDNKELSFVYFEVDKVAEYFLLSELPDGKLLEGFLSHRKVNYLSLAFYIDQNNEFSATNKFSLTVTVTQSSIHALTHPSDVPRLVPSSVRRVLNHFMKPVDDVAGISYDSDGENEDGQVAKPDIDKLYETIRSFHMTAGHLNDDGPKLVDPQHRSLLPKLRPYQRNAVRWMISRETGSEESGNDDLHPLYEEVEALQGTRLYLNRAGGFFTRNRPLAVKWLPGGILADEMGLGKTVEVLSLLLCNPRTHVPKPEWKDPIATVEKEKRKRKRRSPSPIEFVIEETANPEEDDLVAQLDGNLSDGENESPVTRKKSVTFNFESEEEEPDITSDDEDDEYSPPTASASRGRKRKKIVESEEDSEEEKLVRRWKNAAKKSKVGAKKSTRSILKKAPLAAVIREKFDPMSALEKQQVNDKSKLSDLIPYIIAKNQTDDKAVSVSAVKKILDSEYGKKNNNLINSELISLARKGLIVNTSGTKSASGSYVINPEFENFDTRRSFISKPLGSIERVIENVITRFCYDGAPCVDEKSLIELEMEAKQKAKKEAASNNSVYSKLKTLYDQEMAEMSETLALREERRKKWNGQFFATKAEQCEYLECICGSEDAAENDSKHRVQCSTCRLWQHSACVRYDVTDPYRGEYFCPHCWMERDPVESGATLIITPNTILHQWVEEIQKHIHNTNIRLLFYKGTKASGYIQPQTLSKYDLVITTYSVLQSETNYVDLPHTNSSEGRRFRNPKRFMAVPAPLPCINWWRVCLDEAQMIENSTTKTAEMALRLNAINRWCVTGTPIGKTLSDIQGLLHFLQVDPYCVEFWWQRCLCRPYLRGFTRPLETVLSRVMWRTAKKDVLDQINIPKQTEEVHWLSFSPVEEHFYRRTYIECSGDMLDKLKNFTAKDIRLSEMDRKTLQVLLAPLLRLRQSCCHPQAVRGQFLKLNKSTMTMEDLLEQMIKKVGLECEDANRAYISSLNGLAGLDIIEEKWADAADKYREVLRFVQEHKTKVKTDTLQQLHTSVNLSELLEAGHEGIDPTLRDDSLKSEADELRQKYLKKYSNAVEAAVGAVVPISAQVESLRDGFKCKVSSKSSEDEGAWYVQAINQVKSSTDETNLLQLIHEEMSQFYDVVNNREFEQIKERYHSSRMIMRKVWEKIEEIDGMRDNVSRQLDNLRNRSADFFLNSAVDCHLRMSNAMQKNKKKCELCTVNDDIELYESLLFHFVKGEIKVFKGKARQTISAEEQKRLEEAGVFLHEDQRKGTWADSEVERLLRAILKYIRQNGSYSKPEILDDGSTHMKLMETMKKEFRLLRILWRQIYDQVAGVDELNMSIMRLRLRFEDEPVIAAGAIKRKKKEADFATREKDKFETIFILEPHEIGTQRLKLVSDRTIALNDFRKKYGQLLYLENLRNSEYARNGGGENPEPCPICQKSLGTQWSVLQCGHCFCVECIKRLIEEYSIRGPRSSVKCAICRNLTYHSEVSYVNTTREQGSELDSRAYEAVKGSLSTKIEAVVKTLIRIQMLDPGAKSLVFSTWTDVLDILASALTENDIHFAALHDQGKFKRNLEKFKNRDDVKVLLLPVTSGANGLNLISASHVLLIEPILNPAQELQAIGRVHRIGQNKPTVVHKFIIKSTIEERMHQMLRNYHLDESCQGSHSTEENVITVNDLALLFNEEHK